LRQLLRAVVDRLERFLQRSAGAGRNLDEAPGAVLTLLDGRNFAAQSEQVLDQTDQSGWLGRLANRRRRRRLGLWFGFGLE
jgi:hypothetical protein